MVLVANKCDLDPEISMEVSVTFRQSLPSSLTAGPNISEYTTPQHKVSGINYKKHSFLHPKR